MVLEGAREFFRVYRTSRPAMLGLTIILFTFAVAIVAPFISPDPFSESSDLFAPPSAKHMFGTDEYGRDVFSEMIWGTRVSLVFGIGVAGIALFVGVFLGALAGYYGGYVDDILSRFFEIYLMIPALFLIILVVAVFGTNLLFTLTIVGLTSWPSNARLTRAQVMTLKTRAFVQAAVGAGAGHARIIMTHLLPNGMYPVIVNSTLTMAMAILTEASLSFLGLGDPNQPSWGQILSRAQLYVQQAWWLAVFPGAAILVLVLGFNLFGEGANFVMNPRIRRRT